MQQIPIEPRAVVDEQPGERWTARTGAPSASRGARTIAAEYDPTERGHASRLVALAQARLEPHNLDEQLATLAAYYGGDGTNTDYLPRWIRRALQMQALGALITSDHLDAAKCADRRESARVKQLAEVAELMPDKLGDIDAAMLDLWASTLHTDAEAATWRNLRKHARPLADAIKPYRNAIRAATTGYASDDLRQVNVTADGVPVNANVWNATRVTHWLDQIQTRTNKTRARLKRAEEQPAQPEPEKRKPEATNAGGLWKPWNLYGLGTRQTHPNGALGRKWRPTPTGKTLGRVSREITDPGTRIFRTRTSGRGGTVVIDCSGSMALRSEQLAAILQAAGGATVWAYTSERETGHAKCCLHLLAHDGKRAREIPDDLREGYDNGMDGEALRHALKHHRKGTPFIWISDGGVTGLGSDRDLVNDCRETMRKARGLYAHDHTQAVRLLQALARGARPRTTEPPYFNGVPTA